MKYSLWNLMILVLAGPPVLASAYSYVRGLAEAGPFIIFAGLFACAVLVDRPKSHA